MEIQQLLEGVASLEMIMPEFQREYVWSLENAKQLLVSLYKNYPTGSLIFWETTNPPEIKNNALKKETFGLTKVILDGQQRLTTLFLTIKGDIPPYYNEIDLTYDPRHLYFNLQTGDFQYYSKLRMQGNPFWQKVIDCFNIEKVDAVDIATLITDSDDTQDFKGLVKILNTNLTNIRKILNRDYPIQTVPTIAKIDEAIDVFDRVNSKGTKLTDADLVLTHITGKWSQARRNIKKKKNQLKQLQFDLPLDFFTRCIVVALTQSALLNKNAKLDYALFTEENYKLAWGKVIKSIDYLIPILKQDALITSSSDLATYNALIPMISYLIYHENRFENNVKYAMIYWMYLALIWQRYSGQTDQRLDKDVNTVISNKDPMVKLVNEIADQRGRIEVKKSDLEGRGAGHPLYRMLYIITKANKAIDWSNGSPIYETVGNSYSIQSHHIFPQSVLYNNGYNSENHIDKKKVNEIANRAFITRDTNYEIRDTFPNEYLPEIEKKYSSALKKQFITDNEQLWEIDKYEAFLEDRRNTIANEINSYLNNFLKIYEDKKSIETEKEDIAGIIAAGENNFVEFKQTLRFDIKTKQINKALEQVILKTIASFSNSQGGTLVMGVSDELKVVGLYDDYGTLQNGNKDEFELHLRNLVNNVYGVKFASTSLNVKFPIVDSNEICIVEIEPGTEPIYTLVTDKNGVKSEKFYVRSGNSSQELKLSEISTYIADRF